MRLNVRYRDAYRVTHVPLQVSVVTNQQRGLDAALGGEADVLLTEHWPGPPRTGRAPFPAPGLEAALHRSVDDRDERLAFFDDIRGELRPAAGAEVPRQVRS